MYVQFSSSTNGWRCFTASGRSIEMRAFSPLSLVLTHSRSPRPVLFTAIHLNPISDKTDTLSGC